MSGGILTHENWMENYIRLLLIPIQQTKFGIGWNDSHTTLTTLHFEKTRKYHLKFSIPFAKQLLTWEMYFNSLYPELGPDLIFDEGEYLQYENARKFGINVPSFLKWNPDNNSSLLKVLIELFQLYKQTQIELLKMRTETLTMEYNLLLNTILPENFEIILIQGSKQIETRFLIKLYVDMSALLCLQQLKNMEVLLFVCFCGSTCSRFTPELYLPPLLEHLFDGSDSLHIPPFFETQHLVDYTVEIKKCIAEKAGALSRCIEKRKYFITTLLVLQYSTVIEYDVAAFRTVSLLLEYLDFYFILSFSLPLNFPDEKFSILLHSIYHMTEQGKPVCRAIDNFPYSPRWEPKQMITKALAYVIENEVKKFQEISVKNSRF